MGNHASACFFVRSKKTTTELIDAQSNLQLLKPVDTLTAVELMFDNQGYAVASFEKLTQTRRLTAMGADEALSAGKIYFLVPLGKLNSRISDVQMAVLYQTLSAVCGGRKRRSSMNKKRRSRVSPTSLMDREAEDGDEEVVAGRKLEELWSSSKNDETNNVPISGRWSPSLNPILEE